jgi:hypothetical protein
MLSILNVTRAQYGLDPLTLDLTQSDGTGSCVGSIGHSQAMQQSGSIWHVNPSYPDASFPADICVAGFGAAENVGEWPGGDEMAALIALNNLMMGEQHDPAYCAVYDNHACNILNPSYSRVGIGIVYVGGATWMTEDFIG